MSLYQQYLNYLNQALPDISGIFASTPAQAMEETTEETVAQPAGLTREQLLLLYPELGNQSSGGNDNDDSYDDYLNRIDNNAGIYSFKDLRNVFSATPMAAKIGGLLGGPLGFAAGLIGTNVADRFGFTQAGRDKAAREAAAARGLAKQRNAALQAMRDDAAYTGGDTESVVDVQAVQNAIAAANRERRRGGQYDGSRDRGETSSDSGFGGGASPGSQGPGGSDEMGSF
jgi:hypothetical protein